MALSYYIYYRVQPERAKSCKPVIRELMATLQKATGIAGRLLAKRGEPNLWMEIYENVVDDAKFEWELADAAGRLKVQDFLLPGSSRYVECFQDLEKA
jgi:hypothetical protein